MIGASRESLATLVEQVDAAVGSSGFDAVAADLLAVADLLEKQQTLRSALADGGQSDQSRRDLAASLLQGKISDTALGLVQDAVITRWSAPHDLIDALELLAARAGFAAADVQGSLDSVEEELFRFSRAVAGSDSLQMTLTDPSIDATRKQAVVTDLLAERANPVTTLLAAHAVAHLRGRRADAVLAELSAAAAERRDRVVAEVRVAAPLTQEQQERLAASLSRLTSRSVRLNVAVDPAVLGGVHVRIGDEVIDGTVAARMEQARRALTS